jgi:hypothetical protein
MALIEICNLIKVFPLGESRFGGGVKGEVRAVDDVIAGDQEGRRVPAQPQFQFEIMARIIALQEQAAARKSAKVGLQVRVMRTLSEAVFSCG